MTAALIGWGVISTYVAMWLFRIWRTTERNFMKSHENFMKMADHADRTEMERRMLVGMLNEYVDDHDSRNVWDAVKDSPFMEHKTN